MGKREDPRATSMAAIITLALTACRKHDRHEVEALIQVWLHEFKGTDLSDLREAVLVWVGNLDEGEIRAQVPPFPSTLKRIMGTDREVIADEPEGLPEVKDLSRAFKDAHILGRRQVIAIITGEEPPVDMLAGKKVRVPTMSLDDALAQPVKPARQHEHEEPRYADDGQVITHGNEGCPVCNAQEVEALERAQRRARAQQVLDALPEWDGPDETDRRNWSDCRCDGSGMIDDKASLAALTIVDPTLSRQVYPCPKCNADLFGRWQKQRPKQGEPTS